MYLLLVKLADSKLLCHVSLERMSIATDLKTLERSEPYPSNHKSSQHSMCIAWFSDACSEKWSKMHCSSSHQSFTKKKMQHSRRILLFQKALLFTQAKCGASFSGYRILDSSFIKPLFRLGEFLLLTSGIKSSAHVDGRHIDTWRIHYTLFQDE